MNRAQNPRVPSCRQRRELLIVFLGDTLRFDLNLCSYCYLHRIVGFLQRWELLYTPVSRRHMGYSDVAVSERTAKGETREGEFSFVTLLGDRRLHGTSTTL